jgi:hypothetical protein
VAAFVNIVMNLRGFHKRQRTYRISEGLLGSQEGLCSVELVSLIRIIHRFRCINYRSISTRAFKYFRTVETSTED